MVVDIEQLIVKKRLFDYKKLLDLWKKKKENNMKKYTREEIAAMIYYEIYNYSQER